MSEAVHTIGWSVVRDKSLRATSCWLARRRISSAENCPIFRITVPLRRVMGFCISPTLRADDQRGGRSAGRFALELPAHLETARVAVGPSPALSDPRLLPGQVPARVGSACSASCCRWLAAASCAAARGVRLRAAGAVVREVVGGEQFRHLHHGDRVRSC